MPISHLASRARAIRVVRIALIALVALTPGAVSAQSRLSAPDSLTDAEFWSFFKTMSEPDGYFLSENFVSNEVLFQEVIPSLQRSLTKNGVYLGVGPEQNFTYIANLAPRMAVIFDIRRQNAMQHLMYKALFELSATRAEFVSRLFSRPAVARLAPGIAVKALFDSARAALPNDSAYKANMAAILSVLTGKHGFALPKDDIASIERVLNVFFTAGPDVNYGMRSGSPAFVYSSYPTFGSLQVATNADSVEMAFLSTEERYHALRRLQQRNLIVPVVADFGGPSGIRAVADWLKQRSMTVTTFYVSNVEQYLFRESDSAARFYGNVSALPLDSTSAFIRSVPRLGSMLGSFGTGGAVNIAPGTSSISTVAPGMNYTFIRDSGGVRVTETVRDSAGVTVRTRIVDSSNVQPAARDTARRDTSLAGVLRFRRDSIASSNTFIIGSPMTTLVRGGGASLASGIASMMETLDKHFRGTLKEYNAVVSMTNVGPWKP